MYTETGKRPQGETGPNEVLIKMKEGSLRGIPVRLSKNGGEPDPERLGLGKISTGGNEIEIKLWEEAEKWGRTVEGKDAEEGDMPRVVDAMVKTLQKGEHPSKVAWELGADPEQLETAYYAALDKIN
ncbi:hypothetical protein GF360_04095 [candidate division WWE3 bacterium]|nr:hypothetical protein [candidate division WWE3 bacterium]